MLDANKHHNIHLQRAWNKYGSDAFEFFIVEECAKEHELLLERENFHIRTNRENGQRLFNLGDAEGGSFWQYKTEEERAAIGVRISEGVKRALANDPDMRSRYGAGNRGRQKTAEEVAKISATMTGVKKTEEQRENMSKAQKIRAQGDDVKRNMSEIGKRNKGRRPPNAMFYEYQGTVYNFGKDIKFALNINHATLKRMVTEGKINESKSDPRNKTSGEN